MSAVIVAYPPSGAGNHLKNILSLDSSFANSSDLRRELYTSGEREVHSASGRNVKHAVLQAAVNSNDTYIIHGHFGELGPHRDLVKQIVDKRWIIVTIDTKLDKQLLNTRQHRLGQFGNDWYIDEEQPLLYNPIMYKTYFGAKKDQFMTIPLHEFWHANLAQYEIVPRINQFLNTDVSQEQAQELHNMWRINNSLSDYYT